MWSRGCSGTRAADGGEWDSFRNNVAIHSIYAISRSMWSVEVLNEEVASELGALPADMRARLEHIVRMVAEFGLERVREPHVKHLQGPLWEMRLSGRDGIARAIYVTAIGRRIVIVRAFRKKTQKTPRREIELALKRAEEVT